MTNNYAQNDKPYLLIMQMQGAESWYYIRLANAAYAPHEVDRAKPVRWKVVKDIRVTFHDFHSPEMLEKMRAEDYPYGTWLRYVE